MAKKEREELVRFYRGENATVVWDAKNNTELCRFDTGTFTTSDLRQIEILRALGYGEVSLDATQPPPAPPPPIQPEGMPDVRPIPEGITMAGMAKLQASREQIATEDRDGPAVAPPKRETSPANESTPPVKQPKNTPSGKPKKTVVKKASTKRAIKRRT